MSIWTEKHIGLPAFMSLNNSRLGGLFGQCSDGCILWSALASSPDWSPTMAADRSPDISAPENADFQKVEYWDKRYASEAEDTDFDWFRKVCTNARVYSHLLSIVIFSMCACLMKRMHNTRDTYFMSSCLIEKAGSWCWDVVTQVRRWYLIT